MIVSTTSLGRLIHIYQLFAKIYFRTHSPLSLPSRVWKLVSKCHLHHRLAAPKPAMMVPQGTRKWHFSVVRYALIKIISNTNPELDFPKQAYGLMEGTVPQETEPGHDFSLFCCVTLGRSGPWSFSLWALVSLYSGGPAQQPSLTVSLLTSP